MKSQSTAVGTNIKNTNRERKTVETIMNREKLRMVTAAVYLALI